MKNLLPGDIVLIHRGTGWQIFAPLVWLWQWAVGPYHVEMVWDLTEDGYKAFSLQPPVLDIVERKLSDLKISAYRLKNRPENMSEIFWNWGNEKILHVPYVLGWETCGMPPRDFYRDVMKVPCTNSPYPGAIEKFCKGSETFIRII